MVSPKGCQTIRKFELISGVSLSEYLAIKNQKLDIFEKSLNVPH
jgi:hypothetical protein